MYKEKTRLFKSDGTVVKIMNDESIEVYILSIFIKLPDKKYFFEKQIFYPDGSIYRKETGIKDHSLEEIEVEAPVKEKKGENKIKKLKFYKYLFKL